jgi:hypothetical protein
MCGSDEVEWRATFKDVWMFLRGLKCASISTDWSEHGLAGAEALGVSGVNLDGMIKLLEQQYHYLRRRMTLTHGEQVNLDEDLLDILYDFKDKLSTDPRDKLYAVLGLALLRGIDTSIWPKPDYTKPMHSLYDDLRESSLKSAELMLKDLSIKMTEHLNAV